MAIETVEAIAASSAGEPEGVATLDSSGELVEGQLPKSVEIGCTPPTGVTATDTANVKATLKAAGEVSGVAVFNKPGTYAIDEELVRPSTVSMVIGPNVTFQARAPFMGECLLTDSKTEQTVQRSITGGGTLDANNVAAHALWCRYFNHLVLGIKAKHSLQDDVILGDNAANGTSTEPVIEPNFLIQRTAGATPVGHYCFWAQRASDGRLPGVVVTGQETGFRFDYGGWRGFGIHPVGAKYPMQVGIDDNAADNEFYGVKLDTMTQASHSAATGSAASSTIEDPSILEQHKTRPVSGTNIPSGAYVGTVVSGVSFTLVNAKGEAIKPTGNLENGIVLAGVGMIRRVGVSTVTGGQASYNSEYAIEKGLIYGIVFATNASIAGGSVSNFYANGNPGNYPITQALYGNLGGITWVGLRQTNVTTLMAEKSPPGLPVAEPEITESGKGNGEKTPSATAAVRVYLRYIAKAATTCTMKVTVAGVIVYQNKVTGLAGGSEETATFVVPAGAAFVVTFTEAEKIIPVYQPA